jgi:small subunit ribosomal protein S16
MPVKIRLQRHGKKGKPYYWIVAADTRSKRDGKYLEKLGAYNPNTNPATIDLNVDGAVKWLQNGAQPTDTAKAILSYKGALLKNHLAGGVRKGALTEEQAEAKFAAWLDEKAGKVGAKTDGLAIAQSEAKAKALAAEKTANEARIAASVVIEEVAEEVVEATTEVAAETVEEVVEEATETVVEEEVAEEVVEATTEVAAETVEKVVEAITEDATETVKKVTKETTEAIAEEAPEVKEEE